MKEWNSVVVSLFSLLSLFSLFNSSKIKFFVFSLNSEFLWKLYFDIMFILSYKDFIEKEFDWEIFKLEKVFTLVSLLDFVLIVALSLLLISNFLLASFPSDSFFSSGFIVNNLLIFELLFLYILIFELL